MVNIHTWDTSIRDGIIRKGATWLCVVTRETEFNEIGDVVSWHHGNKAFLRQTIGQGQFARFMRIEDCPAIGGAP